MAIDWFHYLAFPMRAARRAALPLALLFLFAYMALKGTYSERGYLNMQKMQGTVAQAQAELYLLGEERMALEHKVNLLKGGAIGRDLLDEEARRVMNLAHADEVVVRMPPTANALYGGAYGPKTSGDSGKPN